jgi:hypothetical protein
LDFPLGHLCGFDINMMQSCYASALCFTFLPPNSALQFAEHYMMQHYFVSSLCSALFSLKWALYICKTNFHRIQTNQYLIQIVSIGTSYT